MYLIDSCGWLEYFTDGSRAERYESFIKKHTSVIVPSLVLFEVYKIIKREAGEEKALAAAAFMQSHKVVPLNETLAYEAADLSLEFSLPLADAVIYATARSFKAILVTGDKHFKKLAGVKFI